MAPRRPQPYRLKWPLTPSQVEGLDEMLQILFKSAFAAEVRTPTAVTGTGVSGLGPPGADGADGEAGPPGPPGAAGAAGSSGVPGAQGSTGRGVPGVDGEDGYDSIVPGPRGNDGGTGPPGAQGATGMGVPGRDGEDGEMGWPGPPGAAGTGGGGSGGLVLLEQHTASSSASLAFTTGITSTYDEYVIEVVNLKPATDAQAAFMQFSTDGGATYATTSYRYLHNYTTITSGGSASPGSGGSISDTGIVDIGNLPNSGTGNGLTGSIRLFNPLSGAQETSIIADFLWLHSDTNRYSIHWAGVYTPTTAVNAFRFLFGSGNIASGTVRLYGLAK